MKLVWYAISLDTRDLRLSRLGKVMGYWMMKKNIALCHYCGDEMEDVRIMRDHIANLKFKFVRSHTKLAPINSDTLVLIQTVLQLHASLTSIVYTSVIQILSLIFKFLYQLNCVLINNKRPSCKMKSIFK